MPVEAVNYISDLNTAWPLGTGEPKSLGDNHIRNIKLALKQTFPNLNAAVDSTPAQLNRLNSLTALSVLGVTGNVDAAPAAIAAGTDGFVLRRSGAALAFGRVADAGLRQGAGVSVIGRSANSLGDVADIVAGANDRFLRRVADVVDFGQSTEGMFAANTVPNTAFKYVRNASEITAAVTPTAYQYEDLPVIDLRRYGMAAASSGAVNRAAIEQALLVAAVLGGAILQAPAGTITFDATVAFNVDNVLIRGCGRSTIFKFDPGVADVLFDFDRGANSVWFCGVADCVFFSTNAVQKTAVRVRDGREFLYKGVVIAQGGWQGAASVGLHMLGREMLWYRDCFVLCGRPVLLDVNPNFATIHTDFFHFENSQIGSTEITGTAVEIANGVCISHLKFEHIAFLLGKWGVRWNDTTSSINSFGVSFIDCRWEQATDATGYCIELTSTVQQTQNIDLKGCYLDANRNGVKLTKPQAMSFWNCGFGMGVGRTAMDITFDSRSTLTLIETHVQVGSTVTLTNALLAQASSFNSAETVIARNAVYRFNPGATINEPPQYRMNSLKAWSWTGVVANGVSFSTPVTRAAYTCAIFKVSAYSAVGPIHVGGVFVWTKNGAVTKVGGTANIVTVPVGVEVRIQDGGSGLLFINVIGQDLTVCMEAEFF